MDIPSMGVEHHCSRTERVFVPGPQKSRRVEQSEALRIWELREMGLLHLGGSGQLTFAIRFLGVQSVWFECVLLALSPQCLNLCQCLEMHRL